MQRKLTAIDCFCGAGGLSLGLRSAGFEIVSAFDSNPKAIETYRKNIGDHALVADARTLSGNSLLQIAGNDRVTLVAGGPPCQGFSVQRRGHDDDERNDLILEFLRIVKELKPYCFLMENVSSLAGAKHLPHLLQFLRVAEVEGYRCSWQVLDASCYGVPQQRKRLFVLGSHSDLGRKIALPEANNMSPATVRQAIGNLPEPGTEAAKTLPNHDPDQVSDLNKLRISFVPEGGGREDIPANLRLPCHAVSVDKAGHRGVYGRLSWDKPSGTITTKCNSFTRGRFAHPQANRNITMREAARLQSFPDDFAFSGGRVDVAHQIGNAVPPLLAAAIGHAISRQLNSREHPVIKEPMFQLELELK